MEEETKSSSDDFQVNCELIGHEGGIRSICNAFENSNILFTGAMDSIVRCWKRTAKGSFDLSTIGAYEHEHWITAMITLPPGVLDECPEGGFITGCMDKKIRIYSAECILIRTLLGHSGGVISLEWSLTTGELISGSWDGTARLWNIATAECVLVLPGHENGVCVLGLPDGTIVTGSTGEQKDNAVVNFRIRLWRNGQVVKTLSDHHGPVRRFVLVPDIGFLSCSNDGMIKLRGFDAEPIFQMEHPLNSEGKPGFVLGVTRLVTGEFVSASEDCSVRVWKADGTLKQVINHPNGLWTVHALPNGDFVTGCDDKIARIFTRDPSRVNPTAVASFETAVQEALAVRAKGPSNVDIEKLPAIETSSQLRGKSDGDVQMFRKNGKAWACQWSAVSGTWVEIGEVTGTGSAGMVDGVAYDMVIPVEIENPRSGGIQKLEIGYNQTDNPFTVAQQFIDKHMLDQNYLSQIADYIVQRSGQSRAPVLGDESHSSSGAPAPPAPAPVPTFEYFPQHGFTSFDSAKISKLMETLKQFNDKVKAQSSSEVALSNTDLEALDKVATTLQQTAYYHVSTFDPKSRDVILKLFQWPAEFIFPGLDLMRLMLTHPNGSVLVGSADNSNEFIQHNLRRGLEAGENIPMAVRMLSLRILVNLFVHDTPRRALLGATPKIIDQLKQYAAIDHKGTRLSLATLLLNYAVARSNNQIETGSFPFEQFENIMNQLLSQPLVEPDAILRCSIALGTLLLKDPSYRNTVSTALIDAIVRHQTAVQNEIVTKCVAELLSLKDMMIN